MSRDAAIEIDWAGEHRTFRLPWAQIIALQEVTDCGPYFLLQRLMSGNWRVQDISHTIRLSLIGGGLAPDKAHALVRDYVESRPPLETLAIAQGVLGVALQGAPDEPPGEAGGEATASGSTTSPMESSE